MQCYFFNFKKCLWISAFIHFIGDNNPFVPRRTSPKGVHAVMGQCYSGEFTIGFGITATNNYSISTACKGDELSWATPNLLYDEYLYQWISAMAGVNLENNTQVNADTNNDGYVSFEEAYIYARDNDRCNETPQYETYRSCGFYVGLNHR